MERRIKGVLSPKASGSVTITENGNYDVVDVANAIVNVFPEEVGGITPEGSITLTSNGVYDVTMYAEVVVDVENVIPEGYVKPSGTLNVTSNGTFDVTEKKNVSVNVPQPSGTIEITENGVVDVTNYANANVNVASSGGEDRLKKLLDATKSCVSLFADYKETSVDNLIQPNDTSLVTKMANMFYNSKITSVPQLNTSNVTDMSTMFFACPNLTSVPQLNTSNVTTMQDMFNGCNNLEILPQLDTSKVTSMNGTFKTCSKLQKIDITHYKVSNTSRSSNMVANTTNLKALIIRSFGTSYVVNTNTFTSSGIANGTGYIYVPRAMVDTLKTATNWSTYADKIRALEDYTIDGTTTGEIDESKI